MPGCLVRPANETCPPLEHVSAAEKRCQNTFGENQSGYSVLDEKPFFEFNILDFRDQDVEELKKFAKSNFDLENILTTANHLKYTRAIKNTLSEWTINPPEELVRMLSTDLLAGKQFRAAVKDQFTQITKHAFQQLIADKINERLKGAMTPEPSLAPVRNPDGVASEDPVVSEPSVFEMEAFQIIRAILRPIITPTRVAIRDAASYCAILFDDNNRKPICRLRFNNESRLVIGLFDENKEEERIQLKSLDDIFDHSERLHACVNSYLQPPPGQGVDNNERAQAE